MHRALPEQETSRRRRVAGLERELRGEAELAQDVAEPGAAMNVHGGLSPSAVDEHADPQKLEQPERSVMPHPG